MRSISRHVTRSTIAGSRLAFVPGAPNPTAGRLVLIEDRHVRPPDVPVNEAIESMLSPGKASAVGPG